MKKLFLKYYTKYKEVIMYLVFGVLTTIVNIAAYAVCARVLGIHYMISTAIAWILAVLFAYVTNKLFVFESRNTEIHFVIKEMASFFACRAVSGGTDMLLMWLFVDVLHVNDMIVKVLSNVIVVIINYVLSKLKKKDDEPQCQ